MALSEKRKKELDAMLESSGLTTQRKGELDAMMAKGPVQPPTPDAWSQQGGLMKAATAVPEAGIGFAKEAMSRPSTTAHLGLSVGEKLANTPLGARFAKTGFIKNLAEDISALGGKGAAQGMKTALETSIERPKFTVPTNAAQKVGAGIEQAAEYMIPGTQAIKLSKSGLLGRSLAEGGEAYAKTALQRGEAGDDAALAGKIGVLTPPLLQAGMKVVKAFKPAINKVVEEGINKGIKPYFTSTKTSAASRAGYMDRAKEAVKTIWENKPSLENADGTMTQRLPTNRVELLEGVQQAKGKIFEQYHQMAKQAGLRGAEFDPGEITRKLRHLEFDMSMDDEVREYAVKLIPKIEELRGVAPEIVEARIKNMNESLQSFFENRVGKGKARLDVTVANMMREQLDDIIESEVGPGYQALKNKYGALKTIEKDVARQVAVELRKNNKGFFDITDVFTGGDILIGALTQNPAQFARGIAGRAIKERIKFMNDPNRAIKGMFEAIEKHYQPKVPPGALNQRLFGPPGEKVGPIGMGIEDVSGGTPPTSPKAPPGVDAGFQGLEGLTLKTIEKLKGKTSVSKQFISDLTNSGDLKQAERDMIRKALEGEGDKVDVKKFAEKVQTELLPLERGRVETTKYEGVNLPEEVRGNVSRYQERVYESPIKTSAGDTHFGGQKLERSKLSPEDTKRLEQLKFDKEHYRNQRIKAYNEGKMDRGADYQGREIAADREMNQIKNKVKVSTTPENYFAHSRVEDMADGKTRRVIEVQSDLFQKGRLEKEGVADLGTLTKEQKETYNNLRMTSEKDARGISKEVNDFAELINKQRREEISKLEPYRNTWHERIIREEIKQAAKDGKKTVLFPTGETAMKVEGLGDNSQWSSRHADRGWERLLRDYPMKVGMEIKQAGPNIDADRWIVTDILGDGRFKAVPSDRVLPRGESTTHFFGASQEIKELPNKDLFGAVDQETFDISGSVDKENPIYRFYEKDIRKFLTNKYKAEPFTDDKGVTWWKVNVGPELKKLPIEAFAIAPVGALASTPLTAKKKEKTRR